jgi:hypothetical protein
MRLFPFSSMQLARERQLRGAEDFARVAAFNPPQAG